jgi:outer membrane PBP1 activator LpoA protein
LAEDAQSVMPAYRVALASGARAAVGPLTRSSVAALAASKAVAIPTLALNVPEGALPLPPNLHALSLSIEGEARQVARLAALEGRAHAVTVVGESMLSRRIQQAFLDEFVRSGGRHVAAQGYSSDVAQLARIGQEVARSGADMAFLALDFPRGRTVRPYLSALPVYATSHIHPGSAGLLSGHELAHVRFVDMPWVLQPDHPAVMIYRQHALQADLDLERLYALGIDAFRIVRGLLDGRPLALDGVTGRLTPGRDRIYMRELTRAQFVDGKLVVDADSP